LHEVDIVVDLSPAHAVVDACVLVEGIVASSNKVFDVVFFACKVAEAFIKSYIPYLRVFVSSHDEFYIIFPEVILIKLKIQLLIGYGCAVPMQMSMAQLITLNEWALH
jgi:hypothetical protein